jgi:hypothetical protein
MLNIYEREYKDTKYDKNITFNTISKQIWKNLPKEKQDQYEFVSNEKGNYYQVKTPKQMKEVKKSVKGELIKNKKKKQR